MTEPRPERESGADGDPLPGSYGAGGDQSASYGQQPYEDPGVLGDWYGGDGHPARVPHTGDAHGTGGYGVQGSRGYDGHGYGYGDEGAAAGREPYEQSYEQSYEQPHGQRYEAAPEELDPQSSWEPERESHQESSPEPYEQPHEEPGGKPYAPPPDDATVALRLAEPPPGDEPTSPSADSSATPEATTTPGGRAARRKAAKRRSGRHGGTHRQAEESEPGPEESGDVPLSRVEARRRARARKPSPATRVSRAVGEMFITTGLLMLLFVSYQLWWTNVRAHAQANQAADNLKKDWENGARSPGKFEPGQGFALLHIPKLDVVVPIAEGISKEQVLDRGMVGHYAEDQLKTAMPDDKTGNFGLAGHRNTHGEPFRYINRLSPGDPIIVETQDKYFVYKMASILPVTSPSNVSVLDPVPKGSGFTGPGRYITLTTCTPEFTSKYRMIVWGKMVEERPRSKGKPDALVS